jgi:Fe-S protein assembly co-chaperone HscB
MNQFHPDRHHSLASSASSNDDDDEEVRSQMATMATDVTRAYSVLEEPLSRSLHLLELGGEAISETDRSIVNNNLLMKIMMVREEVDSASTDEELRPILQSCREEQDELCEKLAASFQKDRMVDAKYLTAELQYWKRVEETIIEKMKSVD